MVSSDTSPDRKLTNITPEYIVSGNVIIYGRYVNQPYKLGEQVARLDGK
jgi:hypothetical protein